MRAFGSPSPSKPEKGREPAATPFGSCKSLMALKVDQALSMAFSSHSRPRALSRAQRASFMRTERGLVGAALDTGGRPRFGLGFINVNPENANKANHMIRRDFNDVSAADLGGPKFKAAHLDIQSMTALTKVGIACPMKAPMMSSMMSISRLRLRAKQPIGISVVRNKQTGRTTS